MTGEDRQFAIWEAEHASGAALPSETSEQALQPSSGVVDFFTWLKERGVATGTLLDIGAGKGRHTLYAAEHNFDSTSLEYVDSATRFIESRAQERELSDRVHVVHGRMDEAWPFADNSFDVVIDSFAMIDIDTQDGREKAIQEMYRVLKPGGYALVMVVAADDDELEAEFIAMRPAAEKNSCFWPNGKFQKDYDEEELREVYAAFTIAALEKRSKPAHKLGRDYIATNYWMILKK